MNTLYQIRSPEELRVLSARMKAGAGGDKPIGTYTKSEAEVAEMNAFIRDSVNGKRTMPPAMKKVLDKGGGAAAILLNGHIISIQITRDEYHGHQWHLSMTEVVHGGMGKLTLVPEAESKIILNAFFGTWKSIENPGKMHEVTHYVGNNH